MTDLTDNAGGLHRAKPRGAIAGLGRTKSRGQCVPHLPTFGRARLNPDCLAGLRPSE